MGDLDRRIQSIIEAHEKAVARASANEAKFEARMSANEKRVDAVEKRLDKRMDAIAKLIQVGMRMMVNNKAEMDRKINSLVEAQMRSEAGMEEMRAAQKDTQKTLKTFIESLQKGRNGH